MGIGNTLCLCSLPYFKDSRAVWASSIERNLKTPLILFRFEIRRYLVQ
jgi:hypothetical protein